MSNFGRLERVDLRNGWISEPRDFTPWLAQEENLALLGETLGIDLELEAQERSVGPFRADLVCKDKDYSTWVLIENQLERTDHTHLGQLITYAAGLKAATIVWIAAKFAEEHRAACDWLNEVTNDNVRVFGIEVELWRIGSSPSAPKFNIVSQPNNWSRSVASAKTKIDELGLTAGRQQQLEYWTAVENLILERCKSLRSVKPLAQSWIMHGLGRTGTGLSLAMNTRSKWVRVDISLSGPFAKGRYRLLEKLRDNIEQKIGSALFWQLLPEATESRISCVLENADPTNEEDWSRQHDWLVSMAEKMHIIFKPLILNLPRENTGNLPEEAKE
ncbi:DUF4268 domain-containing protein [Paracoccus sp. WLY502]|uniref:DUF4268 domain-containing protein n=1 Tax=Paracoccus yibinensis TaxID=3068891 RepID=UPI00279648A7|nr:DUF4268 domain-containing protein [Paracoccus sp. WLY502]MDQ1901086.1 DUF4268 domain-containing protein [Paracoccus sp. WLY502]